MEPAPASAREEEIGNRSFLSIAIVGMAATFIAGMIVATLWFKLTKR